MVRTLRSNVSKDCAGMHEIVLDVQEEQALKIEKRTDDSMEIVC